MIIIVEGDEKIMKKISLIVLITLLMCGCTPKESPDDKTVNLPPPENDIVVTTGDVEDNTSVNTNYEDVKYEPAVRKHEVTKEEQKPKKNLVSDNNESKSVEVNEVVVPKVEDKPKEDKKIESEKKEQITNTDKKENNFVEVEEKQPPKKEEPPKEETKPINYKIGNSGKLFDTEQEADKEAERMFNDYSNPDKYISRYWIWSTYDKWTIEYEYTNWE